ncbi:MAG: VTT domain-containing protein [Parvularculaceae bacterium]
MFEFVRRLERFLSTMDAKAWTSLGVSLALLAFVLVMFVYGQRWLHLDQEGRLAELMMRAAASPWAIIGVVSVYVLLALTGFPQILLFTATVIAFGPRTGALYSWIATMMSATVTFGLGHMFGGRWVKKFGGERAQSMINFLGRHAILASALVRVVPSAPFIVVNAAAGAAHMPLWKYWVGTGVGIVPKIALVAVIAAIAPDPGVLKKGIGAVLAFFTSRQPLDLAIMALIIPAWVGFLLAVRWYYVRLRRRDRNF